MSQMVIPIFSKGSTNINNILSFQKIDERIFYFYGCLPFFNHPEDDLKSFQMIIAQFYMNGLATQSQIVKAFGISSSYIKRAVKRYKETTDPWKRSGEAPGSDPI